MRVERSTDDLRVKAYAGSTGVLLAMDVARAKARKGLLGFAILERRGSRPFAPLFGALPFEGDPDPAPGTRFPSNAFPIQKFRWSDYGVEAGHTYQYRVAPVYGDHALPEFGDSVDIEVRTSESADGHRVRFNRAAAASQAFARTFPDLDDALKKQQAKGETMVMPQEVWDWLSRGAVEMIVAFLDQAKGKGWALSIAIYEYELAVLAEAVERAIARGVDVRIVYHAKEGDPQTEENEERLRGVPEVRTRARVTKALCHHKFVVASKVRADGSHAPVAILAGSTNWTENGLYRQANVVHTVRHAPTARRYLDLFDELWAGADPAATKAWIDANNSLDGQEPLTVGFSPRSRKRDLARFAELVRGASRDVLFATAFNIYPDLLAALEGGANDDILRLGIQNSPSRITGFHRDRTASFVTPDKLDEGFDAFLAETWLKQKGNIRIHTKAVVMDFTSDSPTVLSGSHNLSSNASGSNDENYLIIPGRTDVADAYGIEILRFYEHYRFRSRRSPVKGRPPRLTRDDRWTKKYVEQPLAVMDRRRFAGTG